VIKKLNGGTFPDIKFFTMGHITIAGRKVRALRHGMAGAPGLEVWGPYAEATRSRRDPRRRQGRQYRAGSAPAPTRPNTLESGWIPSPDAGGLFGRKAESPNREWLRARATRRTRG
jgi:vanillate/3-O-methylgallate O-demethylase